LTLFAIQYLEDSPGLAALAPAEVRARLRAALDCLPISVIILGWHLPAALSRACAEEAARASAQIFRWHPLLTGDASLVPRREWHTIGLTGEPVPGFRGLPEFTFVCPNRPAAREAALNHLRDAIRRGDYQGVFLDRIRYPSPTPALDRWLACFCDDCRRAAAAEGLDLEAARRQIKALLATSVNAAAFVRALLDPAASALANSDLAMLRTFLDFRVRSVSRFVQAAADVVHAENLAVGLDCFSPALTYMVGQDLGMLAPHCEWIKIMSYGHTLGPAGLPFELLSLADWLIGQQLTSEREALEWLSQASHLRLSPRRSALREEGIAPEGLAAETRRARGAGVSVLLAGIELVASQEVVRLQPAQITADVGAFQAAGADGLALAWDLWHIPLERLELVRTAWARSPSNLPERVLPQAPPDFSI
jgi:hypothetical protein